MFHLTSNQLPLYKRYLTPVVTLKSTNKSLQLCGFSHHDGNHTQCDGHCTRLHIPADGWNDITDESKAALDKWEQSTPDIEWTDLLKRKLSGHG